MIKIIDGDLFTTDARYICHQVNCQGKMGSGVAKIVRNMFPEAFRKYREACVKGRVYLGMTQYVLSNNKIIINMFAQNKYGFDNAKYTDENAFLRCLVDIHETIPAGKIIAMPYKIGCGLGGGDWDIIYSMIERELGQDYIVELWRLP